MPAHDDATTTERLVLKAQRGDRAALEQLLRDSYPALRRVASRLVRNRDAAQDVVQETAAKVAQNIEQLSKPSAFSSWAYTILRREVVELSRKRKRNPGESISYDDTELAVPSADPPPPFEASEEMTQCLRRLQKDDREVLDLHYWHGLEVREIGAMRGIAAGTVKVRLFRARYRLRDLLCKTGMAAV